MSPLRCAQQRTLTTWQQHTHAEFALKDPTTTLATMTKSPYVLHIPAGTGGVGRAAELLKLVGSGRDGVASEQAAN